MAAELLTDASRATDANSNPYAGATWSFYATGTLTPQNVYANADLSTSLGAVVTADAGGKFVPIYFDSSFLYRGILKSADGATTIYDIDPINPGVLSLLGQAAGAEAIGTALGVTAAELFDLSPLPLTAFASLAAAVEGASAQGRALALRGAISLTEQQIPTLAGNLHIIMEAGTVITRTGAGHLGTLIGIHCNGYDLTISGNGSTIDCANLVNIGLEIRNAGDTLPTLEITGLSVINAHMFVGNVYNNGATGILIVGNFALVEGQALTFTDITREAGSGLVSSFGSAGLLIAHGGGTRRARSIVLRDINGTNISTEDAAGTAGRVDCDLIIVNQGGLANEGQGDSCSIKGVKAKEVLGRAVKCISSCVPIVDDVEFWLSVDGIVGDVVLGVVQPGFSTAVNCQLGVGIVSNVRSTLRGTALTTISNHTPVSFYTAVTRTSAIGGMIVSDLTLDTSVSGAARCEAMVGVENASTTDTTRKVAALKGLVAIGQSIGGIVAIGNNGITKSGTPDPFLLDIDGFDGALTRCAIRSGGSPLNMQATFRSVRNSGSTVDAVKRNDNASLGEQFGFISDGGGNIGIAQNSGGIAPVPSISALSLSPVSSGTSRTTGLARPLIAKSMASLETIEVPLGLTGGSLLIIGSQDYGGAGLYRTNNSNVAITVISAASGVTADNTGVEPAGNIRVWKSSGGTKLTVKNADGVARTVLVMAFG